VPNDQEKSCSSRDQESCSEKPAQPDESLDQFLERTELAERMGRIKHKILILSGKGGVGKSTIAVNLASAFALAGKRVGLLDADIHGPSIPHLLGIGGMKLRNREGSIIPVERDGIKVVSIDFMLEDRDTALIWRGPLKMGVIKEFLKDVAWGSLDYLIIDCPPGTGDEPLSVAQLIEDVTGAIIVTTPQELAILDVRKAVSFCRKVNVPVLGVIENMSGFVCPKCGEATDIFKTGGGERMASEMGVPFLARIPLDPRVVKAGDKGESFLVRHSESETAKAFGRAIRPILERDLEPTAPAFSPEAGTSVQKECGTMRIAIPVVDGRLAMHFGHCEKFVLIDVDPEKKEILKTETVSAPDHVPGLLPKWLAERGANTIIAGGMGMRAQQLFAQQNITVVVGAPAQDPEQIAKDWLAGALEAGENVCDH